MTTALAHPEADYSEPVTQPLTLFGTNDPAAIVQRATAIAEPLAKVIIDRRLFKKIGNSDHVYVEGWTLLGSMLGVFAEVVWSRPLPDNFGWEARAVARTLDGRIVGGAEAQCDQSEGKWKNKPAHQLRSMAQTRAVSKALRLPLGFIMELAKFSATPAEELAEEQTGQGERSSPARERQDATTPAPSQYRRGELADLLSKAGIGDVALGQYADRVGVKKGQRATDEQVDAMIDLIKRERPEAAA